jgi:hypothetical protein
MRKTMTKLIPGIFTRRALVSLIQSHQQDHEKHQAHPQGSRPRSTFPLTLIVGLMTIGVIAIASLLQLLSSWLG